MILKRVVSVPGATKSSSPLSQAVVAEGKFVFISGQVGKDPATGVIPKEFIEQARQALANLKRVLEEVGAGPQHVVRMLVFVTDLSKGEEFNRLYGEFFGNEFPTRTRVQVAALSRGYQIEMEAIAVLPS